MVGKCLGAGLVILACVLGTTLYLRLEKLDKENQETIALLRAALAKHRRVLETTQDQLRQWATENSKVKESPLIMSLNGSGTIASEVTYGASKSWRTARKRGNDQGGLPSRTLSPVQAA